MMTIRKRTLPKYILLNCLTLGIYGFIVGRQIDKEINTLCRDDGEQPRFSYTAAVLFRAISTIIGVIVGVIFGLISGSGLGFWGIMAGSMGMGFSGNWASALNMMSYAGDMQGIAVFLSMLTGGIVFTAIGSIISGIYLNYWWYRQAGRLKLNGYRYGITVRESGVDNLVFRTVMEIFLLPITCVIFVLACLIPTIFIMLLTLAQNMGAYVFAAILAFLFGLPLMVFGTELTAGSNFAMFFIFKNLNRYADASRNGAQPFDAMGYEYYPSVESKYPNFLPGLINGDVQTQGAHDNGTDDGDVNTGPLTQNGALIGLKGSCAGYNFELNPGEEIIIGKDGRMAMVIIDPAYKEISRKHCSVCYDVYRDQYRVIDFSSNGTWANGIRLEPGVAKYLPRGTELKLANDKNIFRLG